MTPEIATSAAAPSILSLPLLQKPAHGVQAATMQPATLRAKVSVLAVLGVLDHWTHRDEGSQRVVGALLGNRSADGAELTITDTFPIVLLDNDSSIDVDFAATMYQLRRRASPREQVLGWYSTGSALDEATPALHDWFEANLIATAAPTAGAQPAGQPASSSAPFQHGIHLLVDLSLESPADQVPVHGFIGLPVASLTDGHQGRMFVPFPADVTPADHEMAALEMIAAAAHPENENLVDVPMAFTHDEVYRRANKLSEMVEHCIGFVGGVIDHLKSASASGAAAAAGAAGAAKKTGPLTGADAAKLNELGHLLARAVACRTDAADVANMDREIRDLKTLVELSLQARKQMMLTEMVTYSGAFKH